MQKLAVVRSCYSEKFGVPRQAGLVPSATAELVFESEFRRPEAVRGLEGFSHVWLVFLFDQVEEKETRLSVRPPRLGGNEKLGVFATRSPFRPNRIGLSAVRLEKVDFEREDGPVLCLSGVDLVDGTAVLDVKPYLPYADSLPEASEGFAVGTPEKVEVVVSEICAGAFEKLDAKEQKIVWETLEWDPRPSYRGEEDEREYHLCVAGLEVVWRYEKNAILVLGITPVNDA